MAETKSKPILMSGAMVRAIIEGYKTQTRRVVKGPALAWLSAEFTPAYVADPDNGMAPHPVGSEMWVREGYYQRGHWEEVTGLKARSRTGRQRWKFVPADNIVIFDAPEAFRKGRHSKDPETVVWHKRLGRFMPRAASRLTLTVTDVRVERLQDISEEDAKAEGASFHDGRPIGHHGWRHDLKDVFSDARSSYAHLWESINGPGSWDANPWVWAYSFSVNAEVPRG